MRRTTSYTEFNAALASRADTAGFNVDHDAGPGLYALARGSGLRIPQKIDDRQLFWAGHVAKVHEHCARRHRTSSGQNDTSNSRRR